MRIEWAIACRFVEIHDNLATMVGNNASFNCNAAKMLITAPGWPQRDLFLDRFRTALAQVPARVPYYPGARERYAEMLGTRRQVERFGEAREGGERDEPAERFFVSARARASVSAGKGTAGDRIPRRDGRVARLTCSHTASLMVWMCRSTRRTTRLMRYARRT